MTAKTYEVRDPIHNFILFNDFEKALIDSSPVQRLKHIKQLALTYEVYPGGTHSRFEHSLGTMELASQAFDVIVRNGGPALEKLGWSPTRRDLQRQLLRIGALLHDIGHAPFSHAPENLLPDGFDGHEGFTAGLIDSNYILPFLEFRPVRFEAKDVIAVALGPEKAPQEDPSLQLLQELIAGELGVDRVDYLVRDSLHTGQAAGRFDYQRFLNTLTVIEHPDTGATVLAVEEGGRHSAEALLLARYFMFLQVYFHDVRRIYDRHLVDFLASWLPEGTFPSDLGDYLRLTDDTIQLAISESIESGDQRSVLAARLRGRNHYRLVTEIPPDEKVKDPDVLKKLASSLEGEFGDQVRIDEVGKQAHTLEEGEIFVVDDRGSPRDVLQVSDLIRSLKPMWFGRVYADPAVRENVYEACRAFLGGF